MKRKISSAMEDEFMNGLMNDQQDNDEWINNDLYSNINEWMKKDRMNCKNLLKEWINKFMNNLMNSECMNQLVNQSTFQYG